MNKTLEQQKQDFIDWFFIQIPYWPTPDQCFDKIIAYYQQSQQAASGDVEESAAAYGQKEYPVKDYDCYESDYDHRTAVAKQYEIIRHFKSGYAAAQQSGGLPTLNEPLISQQDLEEYEKMKREEKAQQSGDGWVWTDALACEWAGYLESKMAYSSVQHIPKLLIEWKQKKLSALPQPPSNP